MIIRGDALRHLADQIQEGPQGGAECIRHRRSSPAGKGVGGTRRQSLPERLDRASHVIDQFRAHLYDLIPRAQQLEVLLRRRPSVLNRMEKLGIGPALAREKFRIEAIIALPPTLPSVHG